MGNNCSTPKSSNVIVPDNNNHHQQQSIATKKQSSSSSSSSSSQDTSKERREPTNDGSTISYSSSFIHEPNSAFRGNNNNNIHPSQQQQQSSSTSTHPKDMTNNNKISMNTVRQPNKQGNLPASEEIPTMESLRASSVNIPNPTEQIPPQSSHHTSLSSGIPNDSIDETKDNTHPPGPPLFSSEFVTGRLSSLTNTPQPPNTSHPPPVTTTTNASTTISTAKPALEAQSTSTNSNTIKPELLPSYVDVAERFTSAATIYNDESLGNVGLNGTVGVVSPVTDVTNTSTILSSPIATPTTTNNPSFIEANDKGSGDKATVLTNNPTQPNRAPLRKNESIKYILNKRKSSLEMNNNNNKQSSSPRRSPANVTDDEFDCEFVEDIHNRYLMDPKPLGKGSFGEVLLAWRILPSESHETEEVWKQRCQQGPAVALKRVQPAPERLSAMWKNQKQPNKPNGTIDPSSTNPNDKQNGTSTSTNTTTTYNNRVIVPSSTLVRDASAVHSEARILHRVRNCEYVVRLMDYCVDNSHVYIGMEHCGGGDLMKFVLQCRNFSERVAAYLFKQMLLGVSYCHSVGVVHRDLKPDNFLFANAEGKAHLKICDFGLATIISGRDKLMHDAVGSAFFIAPEVFSRKYTLACDAWSLGVNLYLLLSGTVPFGASATRAVDVHRSIQQDPLSFHGKAWTNISTSAKELVSGLLDKHPHRRYTVEQALQHPWISSDVAPDTPLDSHVIQNMVKWVNQNRLRKEAVKLVATTLTAADVRKLREQFHAIDTNCDLAISPAELATALNKLGPSLGTSINTIFGTISKGENGPPQATIEELVASMDTDGDGTINLDEFLAATAELQTVAHQTQMYWAFCQYDRNGDGLIDINEAKAVLGDKEDLTTVAKQIAQYDVDGDGRINYEEFLRMLVPENLNFNTLHFVDSSDFETD